MTKRFGLIPWATGILLLAAMSACGSNEADPQPTAPTTTSAPTSPTTSTSPTSPSAAAAANAEAVVRRYYATLDRVRQDPTVPITLLRRAENGIELRADQRLVTSERKQHQRQTGSVRLVSVVVQSVDLDNSDAKGGTAPTAQVDVCWDVSNVDLVDKNGKSVVPSTRPDQGSTRYFVTNPRWSTHPTDGWRVSNGQDLKLASCSGS
ncbi:MAG: hypothetical protein FWD95_00410 [Nocardioidaceae bacterium]|nr:hypothetical protein [Nocardioidaceae bacterium]